jgi:hypothetical protein
MKTLLFVLISSASIGQTMKTYPSLPNWKYVENDTATLSYHNDVLIGWNLHSEYKAGFEFDTPDGCHATLIKLVKVDGMYRWKTLYEKNGVGALGWTQDNVIDLYTKKK